MVIVIDPDVMVASLTDSNCKHALSQVFEELDRLRVAVDDTKGVLNEYYGFLETYIETHEDHMAVKLLQEMLLGKQQVTLSLPIRVLPSLQNTIEKHKCTTPVEPELIGMVDNAKNLDPKLLLAGKVLGVRLRHRGLNDPRARRALKKGMPWLDVRFASDRKELFAAPLTIHCNARLFEFMVARVLQTQHAKLRCIETPYGVQNQLGKAEEIDLYGYEEDGDRLTVWIGECKLREEGRESKLITIAEIAQLRGKMSAASEYERNRSDLTAKTVQIRGLMMSNALDLFDDFVRQEIHAIGGEFWQAELTSGWTTDLHWYIYRLTRML